MSVRKRPEKPTNDIDVEALISKGAHVKEDQIAEEKKWTCINIRISLDMLGQVDETLKARVGIKRTGWILEAIHEKIKRENEA